METSIDRLNLKRIKNEVVRHIGRKAIIESHSSKKKEYSRESVIETASNKVFTVRFLDSGIRTSFTYGDIATGTVRVMYKEAVHG